ncbi:MAG TPA: hypothetical protein VM537_03505, partial [Anaerolineae bacterium]|nr:hypothetical protein [Anaerolineae bacterium]
MPVVLNLPIAPPAGAPYVDEVKIYKRVDALSYVLLSTEPLGTLTYEDPAGLVNDEYHITFSSSTFGVESLPSNIYRVGTPWRQGMGVILELQTTSGTPSVDQVAVYRRRFGTANAVRLGTVPIGTQFYSDSTGMPGDEYHTTFLDSALLAESQPGPSIIANAGSGVVVVTGRDRDIRDLGVTQGPGPRDPFGAGPRVYIELVVPCSQRAPSANGGFIARQNYDAQVQVDGTWSVGLLPNDLITSPDTFYKFTFSDGEKSFKRVLSANG